MTTFGGDNFRPGSFWRWMTLGGTISEEQLVLGEKMTSDQEGQERTRCFKPGEEGRGPGKPGEPGRGPGKPGEEGGTRQTR